MSPSTIRPTTDRGLSRPMPMALAVMAALALMSGCGGTRTATPEAASTDIGTSTDVAVAPDRMRHGADIPFEMSWDLQLPHAVHTSWVGAQIPGLVFVQLDDSNDIYAIDAMSGKTRWVSQPLPKPILLAPFVSRIVVHGDHPGQTTNDDRLYVISDDILFCIDAVYGQLIWRYRLPFSPSSGPVAVGSGRSLRIFVGDWAGRMQVITSVVQNERGRQRDFRYVAWQWPTSAAITAPAVERESLVVAGDQRGVIHCFGLDRQELWNFQAGGDVTGSADILGRAVFVGTSDNILFALDRLTGARLGSVYLDASVKRQPFHFTNDLHRVYAWTSDPDPRRGGLQAIDIRPDFVRFQDTSRHPIEVERMSRSWYLPGVNELVCSTPDHLFVTANGSALIRAINRDSGKIDWAWNLNEGRPKTARVAFITQYWDPTDRNRSIFTADAQGHMIAYRLFGYRPGEHQEIVQADVDASPAPKSHHHAPKAAPAAPAADQAAPAAGQ